jgi:predicted metal-dependent hydrolase
MTKSAETKKFARGVAQFNRGEFFETHETWEEIWLAARAPDRTWLQGMIQIAAAFHHHRRLNTNGARRLLGWALAKLEDCPAKYRGIRLGRLRAAAKKWRAALDTGEKPPAVPRIGWARARRAIPRPPAGPSSAGGRSRR